MNVAIVRCLLWQEYCELRGLWIALAVLGFAAQLTWYLAALRISRQLFEHPYGYFSGGRELLEDTSKHIELSIDPFSGKVYRYYPEGIPIPLKSRQNGPPFPANTPFLWSAHLPGSITSGLQVRGVDRLGNEDDQGQDEGQYSAATDTFHYEMLRSGWPYPIPLASPDR